MAISKVVFGDKTLLDLTEDTVTPDSVYEGYTFHSADGTLQVGARSAEGVVRYDVEQLLTDIQKAQARANIGASEAEHASTHASGGSDPITPGSIGAAAANHTHDDALVGEEYTIAIEPDGGSKEYSSIEIKENATGNKQVEIATQRGFRNVISSWLKLMEGEDSPYVQLLHQSSGYNGLNICDSNLNDRINLYYNAQNDACGMEIFDADGNDVTLQTIGAAAAVHGHAIADVTGLQTALDGKQPAGSYAPAEHTHTPSSIGAASSDHTHTLSSLGAAAASVAVTETLYAGTWERNSQSVSVSGVTTSSAVVVSPHPDYYSEYTAANIRAVSQSSGIVEFACDTVPSGNVQVNILIVG